MTVGETVQGALDLQKVYPSLTLQSAIDVIQNERRNDYLYAIMRKLTNLVVTRENIAESISGPACGPAQPTGGGSGHPSSLPVKGKR